MAESFWDTARGPDASLRVRREAGLPDCPVRNFRQVHKPSLSRDLGAVMHPALPAMDRSSLLRSIFRTVRGTGGTETTR